MAKSNGTDMSEWVRAQPPAGPFLERLGKAIYNHEEKSFLGRTAKRWGIVITFYLVFYAVLAVMFALCMGGLFMSLKEDRPTYTLDQSLIGSNPGVTARPVADSGIIQYQVDVSNSTEPYIKQMRQFFELYENNSFYKDKTECVPEDNFGFPDTPCLFVKLNRILNWEPQYYNDVNNLPSDMPADLIEHIKSLDATARSQLWVSCVDETGNSTTVEYPWGHALDGFKTFRTHDDHVNPMLAVKLTLTENQNTVIRCRAWAKNIIYNKSIKEFSGYARVILRMETKYSAEEEKEEEKEEENTE